MSASNGVLCVYSGELLVETGFSCPAELPVGASYGDLIVCSADGMVPDDFFETVEEQYPDEAPSTDCFAVLCDLGQACSSGVCDSPDTDQPRLTINQTSLDFGTIEPGSTHVEEVVIENVGDVQLSIQSATWVGNDFFTGGVPTDTSLAPGATSVISVIAQHDGRSGMFDAELEIVTDAPEHASIVIPVSVELVGSNCADTDDWEPNDSSADAAAIMLDVTSVATACAAGEDWYVIDSQGLNTDIQVEVTGSDLRGAELELIQSSQVLTRETATAQDRMSAAARPMTNDPIYIRISGFGGGYAIRPHIEPLIPTCDVDALEPNDTSANATQSIDDLMNAGDSALFGLSVCGGDVDWFQIQSADVLLDDVHPVDSLIEVAVLVYSGAPLTVTLHGPSGPVATAGNELFGTEWHWHQIAYDVTEAGEYFVEVVQSAGADVASYRFGSVARTDPDCPVDAVEPNDDAVSATDTGLAPGSSAQLSNWLCLGDEDWYSVDAVGGERLQFSFFHSSTSVFQLELFKDGETVPRATGFNGPPTPGNELSYDVPAGDAGRYNLRVSVDPRSILGAYYTFSVLSL